MKAITDTSLVADLSAASLPVVIKFEAKWCQPCKAMTSVLSDIEKEYGSRVQFFTANVEHCNLIAQRYQVQQIPALIAIDQGQMVAKRVGSASKAEITQWIVGAIPSLRNDR